jgi:hypothetical protein
MKSAAAIISLLMGSVIINAQLPKASSKKTG